MQRIEVNGLERMMVLCVYLCVCVFSVSMKTKSKGV
jgi:hypothetical protein